ncbi:Tol-Pal system beta propeller repeat protein TolB [Marinobacteraceae bacterium S3BR75-40.1]
MVLNRLSVQMKAWLVSLILLMISVSAQAELLIRITEGQESAIPISVVPFGNPDGAQPPEALSSIIRDDLQMSGDFDVLKPTRMLSLPSKGSEIYYRDWRLLGQKFLVVGSYRPIRDGKAYELQYELFDVNQQKRVFGAKASAPVGNLRGLAHSVSDRIYEAITGVRGAFSTRLAFVTLASENGKPVYRLQVSDVDGKRSKVLLKTDEPVLSPDWSPDGNKLAYVSFETGRPAIYVQEIATGQREVLASFKGLNSAPNWSPDGESMLMTLSKEGNAEIYRMDLGSRRLERLTHHWAIDTEPSWGPEGDRFVFTSDRSGGPQVYVMDADGGDPRRLTFEGRYNARPRFGPDGQYVYFVHQRDSSFHIARMDMETGQETVLTRTRLDESPSVAPNGRMLIYATEQGKNSVLAVISSTGGSKYFLPAKFGEVREPAWSPFLN